MRKPIAILLPNLVSGGAERVNVNLANELVRRGYAVDVVLLSATGEFLTELAPEIYVVDLRVKSIRWALPGLVRYLRYARPVVMLACMWPLTVVALWARKVARLPIRMVVAEHTTWSQDEIASTFFGKLKVRWSMNRSFPGADSIVAVSHGAADDLARLARLDRKAITVVYNPIVGENKPPATLPMQPTEWWTGAHRRVLAVGTLKQIKDYATLLRAFARLRQFVDARLLILGEGVCRPMLEELTRRLGIETSVFMPGFAKDTSPYYCHAELHVLSSTGEGLPTVIVEALSAGTPVVSTDCPSGPREILNGGQFGRLVPIGDAEALANAMRESLATVHNSDVLKARAQEFTIDKAVDRYIELFFPNGSGMQAK